MVQDQYSKTYKVDKFICTISVNLTSCSTAKGRCSNENVEDKLETGEQREDRRMWGMDKMPKKKL